MRKHRFIVGEYYHIYNRGTDKRDIIIDEYDLCRFLASIKEFNTTNIIGSIYELSFAKDTEETLGTPSTKSSKLVSIIAYCVNPNHFHLLLTPLVDNGIEKFMQKLAGYTRYFNEKYKRTGVLFQGRFKSKHIPNNTYMLHLSTYINMNNRNKLGTPSTKLSKSSLEEYTMGEKGLCDIKIILDQFETQQEYVKFALDSWQGTLERKYNMGEDTFVV